MAPKIEFCLPNWPVFGRLIERLFPGTSWQVERWGRVERSRSWLGGLIELEVIEHEPAAQANKP